MFFDIRDRVISAEFPGSTYCEFAQCLMMMTIDAWRGVRGRADTRDASSSRNTPPPVG